MLKELNSLISKYRGVAQFEEKASPKEKEKYFLLKRAITLEYNDYRFRHRNKIDYTVSQYLKNKENLEAIIIEEGDKYFSLFSENQFFSNSNILNLENVIFSGFPKSIEFCSMFQFLVFNKSVLFFDRDSAKKALKSNEKKELLKIDSKIENYNGTVWTEYKTKIIEKGFLTLLDKDSNLLKKVVSFNNKYIVFKSNYENWGVVSIEDFFKNEVKEIYNYKNYLGKILTMISIENQMK